MIRNSYHRARWIAGIAVMAGAAVSMTVAGSPCLSVTVPAEVILPDGSVQDPGILRLCFDRHLNPVSEIHEISFAGMPKGLFVGRAYPAEGQPLRPVVRFQRSESDAWILVGFTRPARSPRDPALSIRLAEPSRVGELARLHRKSAPGAPTGPLPTGDEILIAARR